MIWRILGLISGFLGIIFLIASTNPLRHWLVSLLGLVKCMSITGIVTFLIATGRIPVTSSLFLVFNDLIWIAPFGLILWAAMRAHLGIPPHRDRPYSPEEAAEIYQLSSGVTLAEASKEETIVLVFLRHFGCTFTRQLLLGLQELEQQAERRKAQLVLVHMLKSGDEMDYLGNHSNISRIADPQCELYRAFGLGKGGFLELFGPRVILRSVLALIKGCGVGHLAGDGLQMPGAFLFRNGKIIASQPARNASELPALPLLFQEPSSLI